MPETRSSRGDRVAENLRSYIERLLRYLALKNLGLSTAIVFTAVFTFIALAVLVNSAFDLTIRENLGFFIVMSAGLPAVLLALLYLLFGHRVGRRLLEQGTHPAEKKE